MGVRKLRLETLLVVAACSACGRVGYNVSSDEASVMPELLLDASSNSVPGDASDSETSADGGPMRFQSRSTSPDASMQVPISGAGDAGMGMDARVAEPSMPALDCESTITWVANFDGDPTKQDNNGDGQPDWVLRSRADFPTAELKDGVWHMADTWALDTHPLMNFTAPVLISVSMRDANEPGPAPILGDGGAQVWVNYDYQANTFIPVYGSLHRSSVDTQTFEIYGKRGDAEPYLLAPTSTLPAEAMVQVALLVEPTLGRVTYWLNGERIASVEPTEIERTNEDQFATIYSPDGMDGMVEFDHFEVTACLP